MNTTTGCILINSLKKTVFHPFDMDSYNIGFQHSMNPLHTTLAFNVLRIQLCTTDFFIIVRSTVYEALVYDSSVPQRSTKPWLHRTDFLNGVQINGVRGIILQSIVWVIRTPLTTFYEVLLFSETWSYTGNYLPYFGVIHT